MLRNLNEDIKNTDNSGSFILLGKYRFISDFFLYGG